MSLLPKQLPTLTKALILEDHVSVTELLAQQRIERLAELFKTQAVYIPNDDKSGGTLYLPQS